jgi:murein DD-endopeptidase MepM/ murein hydrolase activator NlpD
LLIIFTPKFFIKGFVIAVMVAAILPNYARAFWQFSLPVSAAVNAFIPDTTTPVLQASVNSDPNPDKGLAASQTTSDNALLAYAGPAGTIADVASSTPSDTISVYVVRSGDTLAQIATMFDISVNTIIWANNLSGTNDVHVGDTLIILPISGVKRTIANGDTLKSIATKYDADATEIAQFNGLDPAVPLIVGATIIIPGGEFATAASTKTGKNASHTKGKKIYEPYLGGSGAEQPGYYANPVPGTIITQGIHGWNAVDLGAARGTPIHAAADGTIIVAKNNGAWNGGYGNYVVITHGNGTQTLYAHMTNAIVSPGETVSQGQIIGYVGSTGMSTGAHLHFEVRGAANPFKDCAVGSVCEPE